MAARQEVSPAAMIAVTGTALSTTTGTSTVTSKVSGAPPSADQAVTVQVGHRNGRPGPGCSSLSGRRRLLVCPSGPGPNPFTRAGKSCRGSAGYAAVCQWVPPPRRSNKYNLEIGANPLPVSFYHSGMVPM